MLFVNSTELIVLLVVCAVAAACFVAAIVLLIWTVSNQRRKQKGARELVEIAADCNAVKREFAFGEEFTCDGLIVNAFYSRKPKTEILTQFDVLTEEEFAHLTEVGAVNGLYVIKPNMAEAGRAVVIVRYKGNATYYAITVAEPAQEPIEEPAEVPVQEEIVQEEPVQEEPQEEPAEEVAEEPAEEPVFEEPQEEPVQEEPPVREEETQEIIVRRREPIVIEEESYEGVLRYDKSFTARYIQSSDEIKIWYTTLKNELLSYKKVKARMSWKRETFFFGREIVARLGYRGNTLCIYLPLNPADYAESKYKVEDVSEYSSYGDTPCMYRLKNEKRVRLAIELFATIMEKMGGVRIERVAEDYYLPYEGIVELIGKGLAKRIIKKKSDELIFLQGSATEAAATVINPDGETPAEEQTDNITPAEEHTPADETQPVVADEAAEEPTEPETEAEEETEEVAVAEEQPDEVAVAEEEDLTIADGETPAEEDSSEESTESAEEAATEDTVETAQPAAENRPSPNQSTGQYHGNGKRRKKHKKRR